MNSLMWCVGDIPVEIMLKVVYQWFGSMGSGIAWQASVSLILYIKYFTLAQIKSKNICCENIKQITG